MNEENIRKYAKLMQELGLTGLEIKDTQGATVRMERNIPAPQTIAVPAAAAASAPMAAAPANDEKDYISVRSPMVGVFYAAPAENAAPYVQVGDSVKDGQTLCIIEAMKLMNEIPAECEGTIIEICVKNGQSVDYGCELFRVRR